MHLVYFTIWGSYTPKLVYNQLPKRNESFLTGKRSKRILVMGPWLGKSEDNMMKKKSKEARGVHMWLERFNKALSKGTSWEELGRKEQGSFFLEFLNFIYFLYSRLLVIHFIHISVYMSIPISQFITPPPPPPATFPPWCPYICFLHLCFYSCPANQFICTILLEEQGSWCVFPGHLQLWVTKGTSLEVGSALRCQGPTAMPCDHAKGRIWASILCPTSMAHHQ